MRIATWNVNSLRVRLPHLLDWLRLAQPDIVGLQETKMTDDVFPHAALAAAGYRALCSGQKTYNGVALLAREALVESMCDMPDFEDPQRRVLAATLGELRVINVYVPNGQAVGSEKYEYKLRWLKALRGWLQEQLAQYPKLVLMGDFNIAPEDRDVHDPAAWAGQILCSAAERAALAELTALGMNDVFRQFETAAGLFSWWDYRAAGFRRNLGLRIDLILGSSALAAAWRSCQIDVAPRRGEQPSDHAPVLADFDI
ncbi:MAG: exodeoxyribonuclease III [Steroidobacteraceae bacterium]